MSLWLHVLWVKSRGPCTGLFPPLSIGREPEHLTEKVIWSISSRRISSTAEIGEEHPHMELPLFRRTKRRREEWLTHGPQGTAWTTGRGAPPTCAHGVSVTLTYGPTAEGLQGSITSTTILLIHGMSGDESLLSLRPFFPSTANPKRTC